MSCVYIYILHIIIHITIYLYVHIHCILYVYIYIFIYIHTIPWSTPNCVPVPEGDAWATTMIPSDALPRAVAPSWGVPARHGDTPKMVYLMEIPMNMDDDWGYPYFRKPLYLAPKCEFALFLLEECSKAIVSHSQEYHKWRGLQPSEYACFFWRVNIRAVVCF